MSRIALALLLLLGACDLTPEQRDRMAAMGQSMSYQGAAWTAASRPVYTAPAYAPGALRYCGTDGMGHPWFCY